MASGNSYYASTFAHSFDVTIFSTAKTTPSLPLSATAVPEFSTAFAA